MRPLQQPQLSAMKAVTRSTVSQTTALLSKLLALPLPGFPSAAFSSIPCSNSPAGFISSATISTHIQCHIPHDRTTRAGCFACFFDYHLICCLESELRWKIIWSVSDQSWKHRVHCVCRLHNTNPGVELHSWLCGMLIRDEIVTNNG